MEKPYILYADDNVSSLRLMEELAKESGKFEAICVTSGEELLTCLKMTPDKFSGIIIDMNLGAGKTGDIIADRVRKINSEVPIALLSNYDLGYMADRVVEGVRFWHKADLNNEQLLQEVLDLTEQK